MNRDHITKPRQHSRDQRDYGNTRLTPALDSRWRRGGAMVCLTTILFVTICALLVFLNAVIF